MKLFDRIFSPVFLKRVRKFRRLKRGYWSFLLLSSLFGMSFFSELLVNNEALKVVYEGKTYYPAFTTSFIKAKDFGLKGFGSPNYRELARKLAEEGNPGNYVILAPYSYGPSENLLKELGQGISPPTSPDRTHWLGTDDRGRDVFARLVYGFRLSLGFGLLVTFLAYVIGITIGAVLGYYGAKVDMLGMRIVEIWESLPFLYTVMIVAAVMVPSFKLLALILAAFGWMNISLYVRGEFYREKSRDYVSAATAMGLPDRVIIFRHILPNALTPVISYAPFAVLANIVALVSLDFLGFGLPPPTPSWGELLSQGRQNITAWWLSFTTMGVMFSTLLLISFIGEATREAFDPREYSRLR